MWSSFTGYVDCVHVKHTQRRKTFTTPCHKTFTSLTCSLSISSGISCGSFIHWLTRAVDGAPTADKTQHNTHPLSIIINPRPKQHIVLCPYMNTKWLYGATQYVPENEFSVMYDSKMLLESRAGERLTYYTNTYTKMRNRKGAHTNYKDYFYISTASH